MGRKARELVRHEKGYDVFILHPLPLEIVSGIWNPQKIYGE